MSSPWSKVRLGECCEIVSGATPSTTVDTFWGGEVCWATPKDLSELEGAYISNTPRKLTQAGLENCSAAILPPGSVLFSSRAPIGHVAVNTVPMATNQGFKSFVPKKIVAAKFLYWWLKANRGYLESLGNGATFKEVSKAIVSRIEIPLPPLSDQRRIADVLDRAEALRAKRRAALAELDELTQSIFLDMFGDPVFSERGWSTQRLETVAAQEKYSIVDGPFGSSIKPDDYRESGIPVVRITNITRNGLFQDRNLLFIERHQFLRLKRSSIRANDVLVSRVGTIGNTCIFPSYVGDALLSTTGVCKITLDDSKMLPCFLHAALRMPTFQEQIHKSASTSVQKYFNLSALKNWQIVVPPLALQREFAARVAAVERLKAAQRASLAELDELFASLQHRAFRGEL